MTNLSTIRSEKGLGAPESRLPLTTLPYLTLFLLLDSLPSLPPPQLPPDQTTIMSLKRKQWMETPSPSQPQPPPQAPQATLSNRAATPTAGSTPSTKPSPTKLVSTPGYTGTTTALVGIGYAKRQGTPGTPNREKERERKKMKMEVPGTGSGMFYVYVYVKVLGDTCSEAIRDGVRISVWLDICALPLFFPVCMFGSMFEKRNREHRRRSIR